jgi:uncharacterized membrane protein YphA (DoxX/SURF4 family)
MTSKLVSVEGMAGFLGPPPAKFLWWTVVRASAICEVAAGFFNRVAALFDNIFLYLYIY